MPLIYCWGVLGNGPIYLGFIRSEIDRKVAEVQADVQSLEGLEGIPYFSKIQQDRRFAKTYGRKVDGFPAGYKEPITNKYYPGPREHLADLLAYRQLLLEVEGAIPYSATVPANIAALTYRRESVSIPRTISESQALISHVVDQIMADFNAVQLISMHSAGASRVVVELSDDKMEHHVVIEDAKGKELGRTAYTSTMSTRSAGTNGPFSMSWEAIYEALNKQ